MTNVPRREKLPNGEDFLGPLPETKYEASSTDSHGDIHSGASDPTFLKRGSRTKQIRDVSESSEDSYEPLVVHSDGGAYGWGAWFIDSAGVRHDYWGDFDERFCHMHTTSTSRELLALRSFLEAAGKGISGLNLVVRIDSSFATDRLSSLVSPRSLDARFCGRIERLCKDFCLELKPEPIPREQNEWADYLSKKPFFDNFTFENPRELDIIERKWGPHTIDRFPSEDIRKRVFFTESVDAFTGPTSWTNSNNYCFPPPDLVPKTLRHAELHRAKMTLVVFEWISSPWWSLLWSEHDKSWRKFVLPGPYEWWSRKGHLKLVILRCDFSDVGQLEVRGATPNSKYSTQDLEAAEVSSDYDPVEHEKMLSLQKPSDYNPVEYEKILSMQKPDQMWVPGPEIAAEYRETDVQGQAISSTRQLRSQLISRMSISDHNTDDLRSAAVKEPSEEYSVSLQELNRNFKNPQERVKELEESEKRHVVHIKELEQSEKHHVAKIKELEQSTNDLRAYISSRRELVIESSGNGAELRGGSHVVDQVPAGLAHSKSSPRSAAGGARKGKKKKKR